MKLKITIIGSGVSGLTTGIVLLEAGYEVQILTAAMPHETTSARAAALWFPFQMGPIDLVNRWSKDSYTIFESLAQDGNAGIFMRPLLELIALESDAWWKDALPPHAIRAARVTELPQGFELGYVIQVPIIETPIYLDYLLTKYTELGGTINLLHVSKISDIAVMGDVVINCTGLAAKDLVGDNGLYPIKGQIVKVAPHPEITPMAADMHLWKSETDLAYIIPRSDCIVLGGNVLPHNADLTIDEETTEGIRSRCERLDGRLAQMQFLKAEVGLRPGRKQIRLEREGNVIHNYGHGGGGYTVSWGCAQAVLELVKG